MKYHRPSMKDKPTCSPRGGGGEARHCTEAGSSRSTFPRSFPSCHALSPPTSLGLFSLAERRVTAPARYGSLRVAGRRHFGPRGASGKSLYLHCTPARRAGPGWVICVRGPVWLGVRPSFSLPALPQNRLREGGALRVTYGRGNHPSHPQEEGVGQGVRGATPRLDPACHGLGVLLWRPVRWGPNSGTIGAERRSATSAGLSCSPRGKPGSPLGRSLPLPAPRGRGRGFGLEPQIQCRDQIWPPKLEPGSGGGEFWRKKDLGSPS